MSAVNRLGAVDGEDVCILLELFCSDDSIVNFVAAVFSQLIVAIVNFMKLQQAVPIYHDWTYITDVIYSCKFISNRP